MNSLDKKETKIMMLFSLGFILSNTLHSSPAYSCFYDSNGILNECVNPASHGGQIESYCGQTESYGGQMEVETTSVTSSSSSFFSEKRGEKLKRGNDEQALHNNKKEEKKAKYICSFSSSCGKSFNDSSNLKRHERTHTGEKRHVCLVSGCGRSYNDPSTLKKHARTHTGKKPYICSVSDGGKSFRQYVNLQVHVLTHTKETVAMGESIPDNQAFPLQSDVSQDVSDVSAIRSEESVTEHQEGVLDKVSPQRPQEPNLLHNCSGQLQTIDTEVARNIDFLDPLLRQYLEENESR